MLNISSKTIFVFLILSFSYLTSVGQNKIVIANNYVQENLGQYNLSKTDLKDWIVSDNYVSKHNGVNHIYYQQTHEGIPIENSLINVNVLPDGSVLTWNSRFVANLSQKVKGEQRINAKEAVKYSLPKVGIAPPINIMEVSASKGIQKETRFAAFGNIEREIITKLIYITTEGEEVKLSWVSSIATLKPEFHEWKVYIDASTGEFIKKTDQVLRCSFGESDDKCMSHYNHTSHHSTVESKTEVTMPPISLAGMYNVFPWPIESPNHGNRAIVSDPADLTASPFGWHDTDGMAGAEYTITRGNNVYAAEDIDADNVPGFSPDGGSTLLFDYTLDFDQSPESNTPAAQNLNSSLTNLFYWNNIIHDVFYQYGFDEVSGNFQENNYGKGGVSGDYVIADGLDGGGTNNANFSTPADGGNGRMQMYLWNNNGGQSVELTVNAPGNIAGNYSAAGADFGASTYNTTGNVVEVNDGNSAPSEGCGVLINAAAINGNIALIDRGDCQFGVKALNAENAGAIAVIVCNNVPGAPIAMSPGTDGGLVTIPAVMISQNDCVTLRAELESLNVTLFSEDPPSEIDGSFDNAIIAHEYGHGISIRLTGGPTSSCLGNQEQAGEGWSDFFGLVLSHKAGDTRTTSRGIGTYAKGQNTTGPGIRPYPYTTDLAINPSTYDDIKTLSVPHGVGSVFCTILWDLYWDLIDAYGFDSDIYNGTGGNNIATQLVIDGLKMQPCSPGFIDSRDAILAADRINNGGVNQCLIWNTFARRGLGYSATQGSSGSRSDGTEAFDIPSGVEIIDENIAIETLEGEEITITSTARCQCEAQSDVVLKNLVPEGMSIVSVQNGDVSGNEVTNSTESLAPQETVTLVFLAKIENCNPTLQNVLFEDDIEGADYFSSQLINVAGSWTKTNLPTNSGTNAWYAEDLASESDFALSMNNQIAITTTSVLSFYHKYSTEAAWDGGVVEISTNNGASWTDLGEDFLTNGYQSTINVNPASGLSGRDAFSGSSDTDFGTVNFIESKIDLSNYIGSSILVRFRFASDAAVAGSGLNGWIIDDIKIKTTPIIKIDKEVTAAGEVQDVQETTILIDKLNQDHIFVDQASTGSNHGGDWTNAVKSLQEAIDLSTCNDNITEIWVKAGTYLPSLTNDIEVSFHMATNSKIYGGFAGTEILRGERDVDGNSTILSGDLGIFGDSTDNSIHVISNIGISNALLDGFIIEHGNAYNSAGGGMLNDGSEVSFNNCTFNINTGNEGGAVSNIGLSNISLKDCTFINNTSTRNIARAISNTNSQLTLNNVIIIDPLADGAGNTIKNAGPSGAISAEGEVMVIKE